MRAGMMLIGLAALAACGTASAASTRHHRSSHRPVARHAVRPPAPPAHHMSALAAAAAGQIGQPASFTADSGSHAPYVQFRAGNGDARFGAFRRSYQMDADRPLVMPDADGAVGLSLKFKSH